MRGRKPALAFWLLVAVADLALVVSAVGVVTAFTVLACLVIAGAVFWQSRAHTRVAKVPSRQRRA
jgi:hypothetical protein